MDFVNIELLYHAKAMEMFTMCHEALSSIDEEEDLEVKTLQDFVLSIIQAMIEKCR